VSLFSVIIEVGIYYYYCTFVYLNAFPEESDSANSKWLHFFAASRQLASFFGGTTGLKIASKGDLDIKIAFFLKKELQEPIIDSNLVLACL